MAMTIFVIFLLFLMPTVSTQQANEIINMENNESSCPLCAEKNKEITASSLALCGIYCIEKTIELLESFPSLYKALENSMIKVLEFVTTHPLTSIVSILWLNIKLIIPGIPLYKWPLSFMVAFMVDTCLLKCRCGSE